MKISFERKSLFILFLIAFSIFAISIHNYGNNNLLKKNNYWVKNTHETLLSAQKVIALLKEAETEITKFIITRDSAFLRQSLRAKQHLFFQIQNLKVLVKEDNSQLLRVDTLNALAQKKIEVFSSISLQNLDNHSDTTWLKNLLREDKIIMDKIGRQISIIEMEENKLLKWRETVNIENNKAFITRLYIFGFSLFLIFFLAYFIIKYNFSILKEDSKSLFRRKSSFYFFNKEVDDIIEGVSDPFFALDKNWKFIYFNTAAQKKMGYDKGSLIGKNIFTIFSRYKETLIGHNLELAQQTQKPISFEAYDDFFNIWQDLTIYPTSKGVTVYIKDATARKANESELVKTKQFLAETNEVAMVGGWELDIIKGTVYWTSITRLIHETTMDFIPDLKTGINFYKEGVSRDKIKTVLNKAISEGIGWDTELQIVTAKGNEKWVRTKGKTEFNDKNECVRLFGTFQDIDEQKELDYKLKESEDQFRSAFENSTIGMALISAGGNWKEVNDSLCHIVGYNRSELQKLKFQDITYQDDQEGDLKLMQELIDEKRQSFQREKRYLHKDGHIVWVLLSVSLMKDHEGKIIHFISQIQDITERKQAEKALQEERKLLHTIIDNLPLNVYLKDLQSRKTLVNKSERVYMGDLNENDILGKDDHELYDDFNAEISIEEDQEVFKTGSAIINKETLSIKKDGTETWFLSSKIPFKNDQNEISGLLGISYDITKRNQMTRALEASKQKLSTLFDLSPVGFALSELKSGKFLEFNKAFANKLGYDGEELKQMNRQRIKPNKYWDIETKIIQSLNEDTWHFGPIEMEHIRKDGSTYPILLNGVKVISPEGLELIWIVVQDITNLKEKEVQLKFLNISVEESNRALAIKNEELEQFAYVASHDLQEPLRMISAFMSKIESKYYDLLDEKGKTYIRFAVDGATRLRQLITNILDYSRLDSGPELKLTPVDLNILVKEIIEINVTNIEDKNAELLIDNLPIVYAHKTSMEQLFSNLITNALKYQAPGNKPIVKIKVIDKSDHWEFSIEDNGIGIDPKYFHKVFNVFQRLHTKEKYSGTGIGLAICKKIINNLNGQIWIDSIPTKGTIFYFTIRK